MNKNFCEILKESKTVAVVGISHNPNRPSRDVVDYLINNGYKVVGVNPLIEKIEGIEMYNSLPDIPFEIDIVDVFRKSENIPDLIPDVLKVHPKTLWLQLGIRNDEAVKPVIKAGIITIQDYCIKIEHSNCF